MGFIEKIKKIDLPNSEIVEIKMLENVSEGKYFLSAIPLNLKVFEGSPCRAYLIKA